MRLIRGRGGWWYIGHAGIALIPDPLVRDGQLSAEGARQVAEARLDQAPVPSHYSLTVLTATDCNLGCHYCFQNAGPPTAGRYPVRGIGRAVLGGEAVGATVSFAAARMADLGVSRLRLLLFGGEPLLNRTGCLALLRRCAERFPTVGSMITNGTLLSQELAAELQSAGLRAVQVTLDGARAAHDAVRTTRAGRGTFDVILANVAAAQERTGLRFTIRVNLTLATLPTIGETLGQAARVIDAARTRVAFSPVLGAGDFAAGSSMPSAATADQVVRAYADARQLGFLTVAPRDGHCDFCSARDGRYGAVVNADGALFSSWESAGRPGYEVGTVADGYGDYPAGRWVSCGAASGEDRELRAFNDAVDAGLLDLMRAERQVLRTGGR